MERTENTANSLQIENSHACGMFSDVMMAHGSLSPKTVVDGLGDLAGFGSWLLDEKKVVGLLESLLYAGDPRCPRCGAVPGDRSLGTLRAGGRVKCGHCDRFFGMWAGTMLQGCKMDPREVVLIAFLLGLGVSVARIAVIVGRDAETVRLWARKFEQIEANRG